jgi:hypothetical protein
MKNKNYIYPIYSFTSTDFSSETEILSPHQEELNCASKNETLLELLNIYSHLWSQRFVFEIYPHLSLRFILTCF